MTSIRYEALCKWLAGKLPRRLVYWCAVRVAIKATTGEYNNWKSGVTVEEMLDRWNGPRPLKHDNCRGVVKPCT